MTRPAPLRRHAGVPARGRWRRSPGRPCSARRSRQRPRRRRPPRTPLRVSVETLAPAVVPTRGRVTLTGQITNRSQDTWTDLKVYLFTSPEPITEPGRAGRGRRAPPETAVDRQPGHLARPVRRGRRPGPGATRSYRVSVPRASLGISGAAGRLLGRRARARRGPGRRDAVADGRARTLHPARCPRRSADPDPAGAGGPDQEPGAPRGRRPAARPRPAGSGRCPPTGGWTGCCDLSGRATAAAHLGGRPRGARRRPVGGRRTTPSSTPVRATAGSTATPRTPAAVARPRAPARRPAPSAGDRPTPATSAGRRAQPRRPARRPGLARRVPPAGAGHTVAAVPYGDLDVAVRAGQPGCAGLYDPAVALSADDDGRLRRRAQHPVVAPPSGCLPDAALRRRRPASTPVLLDEAAFPQAARPVLTPRGPGARRAHRRRGRGSGGPGPNAPVRRARGAAAAARRGRPARAVAATPTSRWSCPRRRTGTPATPGPQRGLLRRPRPALAADGRPALGGGDARRRRPRGHSGGRRSTRAPTGWPSCRWPTCWPPSACRAHRRGATAGCSPTTTPSTSSLSRTAMLASSENARDDADQAGPQPGEQHHRLRARADAAACGSRDRRS